MKVAVRALCAMLAVCGPAGTVRAGEMQIEIKAFAFEPGDITVAPGTTVIWVNRDQTIHNVVNPQKAFASPGLDTDDSYTFRFDTEGDFTYLCALHPHMTGIVHVHAR